MLKYVSEGWGQDVVAACWERGEDVGADRGEDVVRAVSEWSFCSTLFFTTELHYANTCCCKQSLRAHRALQSRTPAVRKLVQCIFICVMCVQLSEFAHCLCHTCETLMRCLVYLVWNTRQNIFVLQEWNDYCFEKLALHVSSRVVFFKKNVLWFLSQKKDTYSPQPKHSRYSMTK